MQHIDAQIILLMNGRKKVHPCALIPRLPLLSAAAACVQPAEEVRARRAEGPTAHAQTLRTRAHGRPQEGRADSAAGTCV